MQYQISITICVELFLESLRVKLTRIDQNLLTIDNRIEVEGPFLISTGIDI